MCFNPRTHEGCDKISSLRSAIALQFQSTHPRGVRPQVAYKIFQAIEVSIHAPTRGATLADLHRHSLYRFQSTHPRGVRHSIINSFLRLLSFNPRTHEGCDEHNRKNWHKHHVSIHAPTRGATITFFCDWSYKVVSIHAPTMGATITFFCDGSYKVVSIHAPTMGATNFRFAFCCCSSVSIHAPTRGATGQHFRHHIEHGVSIHAPTRGATSICSERV